MKEIKTYRDLIRVLIDGHTVDLNFGEGWETIKTFQFDVTILDVELLCEYRINPTKPSIDWSQVSEKYRYLARDEDGLVFIYENKPGRAQDYWWINGGDCSEVSAFKSLEVGTCDWEDSLVERPRD